MRKIKLLNISRPSNQPFQINYCSSFLCRLRGLTFRKSIGDYDGCLLVQPNESRIGSSIHMLFVWMDLGVIWINAALEVVDLCHAKSWGIGYFPKEPAKYVLEISPSLLDRFKIGDQLKLEENPNH